MKTYKCLIVVLCFISCFIKAQQIDLVQARLKEDELSIETFRYLSETFKKDSAKTHDLYIALYNIGAPLVRLFDYEILYNHLRISNNKNIKNIYNQLIENNGNYIKDDRRKPYFNKYLNEYFIMPPTD